MVVRRPRGARHDYGGPEVNGNEIAIRCRMDITNKESGQRMAMDEVALYTIKDGKIAEERFPY